MNEMVKKKSELIEYVAKQEEFFSDSQMLLELLTGVMLSSFSLFLLYYFF